MNEQRIDNHMQHLDSLLEKVKRDDDVLAVLLFGSSVRMEDLASSDVDICLLLRQKKFTPLFLSQKKMEYLQRFNFDIHIFQQLPIYIRVRVLREGKILYCRDEDELYTKAFRTIEEFDHFRPFYDEYLRQVAHAG